MQHLIAVSHLCFEDLGGFAPVFADAGITMEYLSAPMAAGQPDRLLNADMLVLLGGPIGANDEALYPHLSALLQPLRQRLQQDRPTLGVCLGGQLIARALGAEVEAGVATEIGFKPLQLTEAGKASCLAVFAQQPQVLHWHSDIFGLPRGATRLASTDCVPTQAFSYAANTLAIQFHPEFDGDIESWLIGHACELAQKGIDVPALREQALNLRPELRAKAAAVAKRWLEGLA